MKPTVLAWWVWLAIILGVIGGLLYPKLAHSASYSLQSPDGDYLRLTDEPCPVASGWLKLKKAEMRWKGKEYAACWLAAGQDILIIDEAGDISSVPTRAFKRDTQA